MNLRPNTPVRILARVGGVPCGEINSATRFVGTVEPGTIGDYLGPMRGRLGSDEWHIVHCGDMDIPLHASQFEAVE
jgi:hypothetical protein